MNLPEVESVIIGDKSFFYNKGDYEILKNTGAAKLMVLRTVRFEPIKIGQKGLPSRNSSIDSYTALIDYSDTKQLTLNQDVDVTLESSYFLMNSKGESVCSEQVRFCDCIR